MSNAEKIIEQGYFYNVCNNKCHILHRTDEYIVYKYFSYHRKSWRFIAESTFEFEVNAHSEILRSAKRRIRK